MFHCTLYFRVANLCTTHSATSRQQRPFEFLAASDRMMKIFLEKSSHLLLSAKRLKKSIYNPLYKDVIICHLIL